MNQPSTIYRARPGYEDSVVKDLRKHGTQAWSPKNRITNGSNRDRYINLLDNYILVPGEAKHRDILGPVYFGPDVATVPFEQVQALKLFLGSSINVIKIKIEVSKASYELKETGLYLPALGLFLSYHPELFLINKEQTRTA
jgi:hypothetical protein